MLFDEVKEDTLDWYDVCPNADPYLPPDENMRVFDACLAYTRDTDRIRVANILATGQFNRQFVIKVLHKTLPDNKLIPLVAYEMLRKVPDSFMASALALCHNGRSGIRIVFPDKRTNIPSELMEVFGLRLDQREWFDRLASNKRFVSGIVGSISTEHWKYIPLDITTLLKNEPKEVTAPSLEPNGGATLW